MKRYLLKAELEPANAEPLVISDVPHSFQVSEHRAIILPRGMRFSPGADILIQEEGDFHNEEARFIAAYVTTASPEGARPARRIALDRLEALLNAVAVGLGIGLHVKLPLLAFVQLPDSDQLRVTRRHATVFCVPPDVDFLGRSWTATVPGRPTQQDSGTYHLSTGNLRGARPCCLYKPSQFEDVCGMVTALLRAEQAAPETREALNLHRASLRESDLQTRFFLLWRALELLCLPRQRETVPVPRRAVAAVRKALEQHGVPAGDRQRLLQSLANTHQKGTLELLVEGTCHAFRRADEADVRKELEALRTARGKIAHHYLDVWDDEVVREVLCACLKLERIVTQIVFVRAGAVTDLEFSDVAGIEDPFVHDYSLRETRRGLPLSAPGQQDQQP